ncbi:fibronectin type III domain-containing protein [Flavobacterium sp.]|uniref:fibronectin type III domain-containing protein n=1 Tax=Flavobacterium sp. TaxID=239 RepID=UPI00374DCD59
MDTKMQLLINPTDIAIAQRQIRLKLYIQGNGLNIQSSDYIQGQRPIFINGGELQTLTNTDIAALFRLENLQGISAAQYANGLPEGMYNFCFEMYDFVTNQKISQKSCASLYLILNDPPLLNTPQKNEQIASTEFPNILFTWTPRQINATNVSYKFELKQLIDPTLDPQFAFQMSPILYEETLFSTALLYNLSMPILTPGLRYAWRVKAISTTGLSENAVFKNDGYSEIYSFKYTASCAAPTFLLSEAQNSKSVKITWEGTPEHTRYQLQYKKQDVRNAQWFSTNSLNTQSLITNLEPGVTYQFRVGSSCDPSADGVQSFTYSGISTFTTPTQTNGVPAYNCGIIPQINIQNKKVLDNLIISETFKAGDFPVTVLQLEEQHSPYTGIGYIIVPYLADTKIAVEFKNILINTDYQLISGVVETSYNPDWKNITDVEDFTGEGEGGQIEKTVPFVVKDIVINANGDILVNGVDGQQVTIPGGKDTLITDSKGNTYNVDKNGNGSNEPIAAADGGKPTPENTDGVDKTGQATAFTAKGISIAFSGNGSKYAFDVIAAKPTAALEKLYKKVGDVVLPYKAVLNGYTDTVVATVTVTDANIQLDSIVFKTQNGAKIDFKRNEKVFVLNVKGSFSYAEEQILATIKQGEKYKVIGAFMLVHISSKEVNVALVPTDDVSEKKLDAIITSTQAIYNKVGIKINFKKEGILNIDGVSGSTIQTEKNTITSTYSTEQQNINALYTSTDNSYVLFITNKPSSKGQDGYMRLNGQFGYVFPSKSEAIGLKTPAHELGHGIFKLEHPFETYKTSESSTDLLMDYSAGTVLNHQDWKQINDPVFKLYAFQSQASGEYKVKNLTYICVNDFYKHKSTTTYFDLDGSKILLKSNYAPYAFVGEDKSGHKGQLAIIKNLDTGELYYPIDSKDGTEKHGYRGYDAYNKFSTVFQGFTPSKEQGILVYANSKCEYFENEKSLGINQNCYECVGLPKNTGSAKNNVFTINELTFKLPDEYSVIASDKNEITSSMSIIVDNDRRDGREDKEDQRSDNDLLPSDKNAEDIYKEVATLWNNYENIIYKEHLEAGVDIGNTIAFTLEKRKLDDKKLFMPKLISDKTLSKISEKFLQDFFENKIKGFKSTSTGMESLYDQGSGNANYEQAGSNLVQHFYKKVGGSYYKTKIIADAIYKTEKGKNSIDNMIKLVDQVFQYKMNMPIAEWNNSKFLQTPLDNKWFSDGIDPETFPSFGAISAAPYISTDEEKIGLFCIGGTQAAKVGIKEFKPLNEGGNVGYEATVIIQYLDTFGVSESDYTKDLPYNADVVNNWEYNYRGGVLAQWILQHQYGYKPFNDYLTYSIKMKKTWKK